MAADAGAHGRSAASPAPAGSRSNRVVGLVCGGVALLVTGAAAASWPLYNLYCETSGYNGTVRTAAGPMAPVGKSITIRLDSNVATGLPLSFEPKQRLLRLRLGETGHAAYRVKNLSGERLAAHAIPSVAPDLAGAYFSEISSFAGATLAPGEEKDLEVSFVVDPKMLASEEMKDASSITLSYTFFPGAAADVGAVAGASTVARGARGS